MSAGSKNLRWCEDTTPNNTNTNGQSKRRRRRRYQSENCPQNNSQNNSVNQYQQIRGPRHRRPKYNNSRSETDESSILPPETGELVEGGPLNLPGFVYNTRTKKYFRMDGNDLSSEKLRKELKKQKTDYQRETTVMTQRRSLPKRNNFISFVNDLSIGKKSTSVYENNWKIDRMIRGGMTEPFFGTIVDNMNGHVRSCEFLEISDDGEHLLACFQESPSMSWITSMKARIDENLALKHEKMRDKFGDDDRRLNTMGLVLEWTRNEGCLPGSIVDLTLAQMDRDAVCSLGVYAKDVRNRQTGGVKTVCVVDLLGITDFSNPNCHDELSSPIYNRKWKKEANIWSIGWNERKTQMALGLEDGMKIINAITDQDFIISSHRRRVISQKFSTDGNLLYMGLRGDDVIRSDLRMKSRHIVGRFKDSKSTGNIRLLPKTYPDCILTENFSGQIAIWDPRWSKKPVMEMVGHRNLHHRLSFTVDKEENFVFAVGNDSVTRGWSLSTGDLVCAINSPHPNCSHFPRIVYSDIWGGRYGNSALVMFSGDEYRVHSLLL